MSILSSRRARPLATLAVAAPLLTAVLTGAGWSATAAQDATPTPGVLTTPAAEISCADNGAATIGGSAGQAPAKTYGIVSDKSNVQYVAQEELAGKGANTAIGKTSAFIGNIYFDANGAPLACSRFDVDLRTLTSDSARRDNYLYGNTLETEKYPLATFIVTSVEGLDGAIPDGQQVTLTLIGNLTIHGVTKTVSWEATVTRNGDALTGKATTSFNMPDFNIEPPKVGPVLSLDEHVTLEADITAAAK